MKCAANGLGAVPRTFLWKRDGAVTIATQNTSTNIGRSSEVVALLVAAHPRPGHVSDKHNY
eukprot:10608500-Prorocentrum_lima.AAC.1